MEQFVRYIFLLNFLLYSFLIKAQFDNEKYNKEIFLIGTLNDYMGYQRTFTNGNDFYYERIDIMSKHDLKFALFIDSLFNMNYSDITIVNNGAPQGIKMYSPTLSLKIDNYYNFESSIIRTGQGDTIYSGKLKEEKFTTNNQKLSFLLGAYLRYGENQNEINSIIQLLKKENLLDEDKTYDNVSYGISIPNAHSKAKLCVEFLEDLDCKNVTYIFRNSIPAGNFVIFKPSDKILDIIYEAELLVKYIETIKTNDVIFTPDGTKYIWKEPYKTLKKKDFKSLKGVNINPIYKRPSKNID